MRTPELDRTVGSVTQNAFGSSAPPCDLIVVEVMRRGLAELAKQQFLGLDGTATSPK